VSFSWAGAIAQLAELVLAVLLAPLLLGWVNMCRAWLQNKRAPGLFLPYRVLRKLLAKDAIVAHGASPLFRVVPYVLFGAMGMAAAIVPTLGTDLPYAPAADAIALVGILALARVAIVLFTAALISQTTSLATAVETLTQREFAIYSSLAFAGVAFTMVSLAENARIPVDNPATHLELTMIHEAMVLEYSGRHLALVEWAAALKLFVYSCIGIALFFPFGIAPVGDATGLLPALPALVAKLAVGGFLLALIETLSAKMRIFRAPEFLGTAFMLAVLALLLHTFLEGA
jgi:formate hydrogenlyase subunit 4